MQTIKVTGMSCGHCVASVTKTLEELGLTGVNVSLEEGQAKFENPNNVEVGKIISEIEDIGFGVQQ